MSSDFQATASEAADLANRWCTRYYKTVDSRNLEAIEQLYAGDARIAWNGTPLQPGQALRDFHAAMPSCKTQVDCMDCHPLPRPAGGSTPLLVAVSVVGKQSFYDPASPEALVNRPAASLAASSSNRKRPTMTEDEVEQLPRAFHQSFVIAAARDAAGALMLNLEGEPVYVARSDCFRFVG